MSIKKKCSNILKVMGIPKLLLVLGAGIVLVVLTTNDLTKNNNSGKKSILSNSEKDGTDTADDNASVTEDTDHSEYAQGLEKQLSDILSHVKGVGRVEAVVTLESGTEKVALKDSPYSVEKKSDAESRSVEESTVCAEDGSQKSPYIIKEIEPVVKGVVIAVDGGDDASVEKEIIEAVSVLFGIESHKIKVMKLE